MLLTTVRLPVFVVLKMLDIANCDNVVYIIYKFKKVTWLPSFMAEFLRGGVPSFGLLHSLQFALASFTLTVHINALYNESVHGREEHAT